MEIPGRYVLFNHRDYDEGEDIRPEDVCRPKNHKFFYAGGAESKIINKMNSPHCPTYGSCEGCLKSGPTGKECDECRDRKHKMYYKIQFYDHNVLDSITIAELVGKGHEVAKGNRMYHWIRTPSDAFNTTVIDIKIRKSLENIDDIIERDRLRMERLGPIWDLCSEVNRGRVGREGN